MKHCSTMLPTMNAGTRAGYDSYRVSCGCYLEKYGSMDGIGLDIMCLKLHTTNRSCNTNLSMLQDWIHLTGDQWYQPRRQLLIRRRGCHYLTNCRRRRFAEPLQSLHEFNKPRVQSWRLVGRFHSEFAIPLLGLRLCKKISTEPPRLLRGPNQNERTVSVLVK